MYWVTASLATAVTAAVVEADLVQTTGLFIDNNLCLANIFNSKPQSEPFIEVLANKWTHYCANISIGTPPQPVLVQLDTGSTDLWVPGRVIKPEGFSPSHSSTFKYLNLDYYVRYIKGYAEGYWGSDTVSFTGAGIRIEEQPFGVATKIPESTNGILGIGPSHKEHVSIADRMVAQGISSRNAFSVYLGNRESKTGKILFGGVDTTKFAALNTVPLKSNASYTVGLNSVSIGNYTSGGMDVVLDTGTSLVYLPEDIVDAIATRFGATFNPSLGMYVLKAYDHAGMPDGVTFRLGGATIFVSRSELFWPLSYFTLEVSPYRVLTLVSNQQSMGINVLGSSFLRSAYVLFEPDMGRVRMGQFIDTDRSSIIAL